MPEPQPVEDGDIERLAAKIDEFTDTLEPAEQLLFQAMLVEAGGVTDSEVEGFALGSFRGATMLAMDPLRGGTLGAKNDPPTWMEWTQSRDIPV